MILTLHSPVSGAGATTITCLLATALARRGHRVAVLDLGHLPGASLALRGRDHAAPTLVDVLAWRVAPHEALVDTGTPGVSLLAGCGGMPSSDSPDRSTPP